MQLAAKNRSIAQFNGWVPSKFLKIITELIRKRFRTDAIFWLAEVTNYVISPASPLRLDYPCINHYDITLVTVEMTRVEGYVPKSEPLIPTMARGLLFPCTRMSLAATQKISNIDAKRSTLNA